MDPSQAEESLESFTASMPAAYRASFDGDAVSAHHAIARRRGSARVHLEIWRELPERTVAVCVVADDQPGLLSAISAALVVERIDIVSAHAFCRTRTDGAVEAVDLLWIRRLPGARESVARIRSGDLGVLRSAIERAIAGDIASPGDSERVRTAPEDGPAPITSARIRFDTETEDGTTLLTVEAVDRPGLLLAVTQALFRAGLQIVGLRATTERGCAIDRFSLVEGDGRRLEGDRLLALQSAIIAALDEGTFARARGA